MAGSQPRLHLIDGKLMTFREIAAMLGISENALRCRHSSMNRCSYQLIVDMYRDGVLLTNHDRWPRHLVNGRRVTVQQAAQELGCKPHSIENWRSKNSDKDGRKPTLAEAYQHFKNAPKRGPGSVGKIHTVKGKKMTVREAAEKYGTTVSALRQVMSRHSCSLEEAVNRYEKRKTKAAVDSILSILLDTK